MRKDVELELRKIADQHDGRPTPDHVIAEAKSPKSPLHSQFNWNLKEAALAHWRDTARDLLTSVKVEVRTTKYSYSVPAYVREIAASPAQGYISLARLRTDEDAARAQVVAEFARAANALTRARGLAIALGLSEEIEMLQTRITILSERLKSEADQPGAV